MGKTRFYRHGDRWSRLHTILYRVGEEMVLLNSDILQQARIDGAGRPAFHRVTEINMAGDGEVKKRFEKCVRRTA